MKKLVLSGLLFCMASSFSQAQTIGTWAGKGSPPGSTDGTSRLSSYITHPEGIAIDGAGRVWISVGDSAGHIYGFFPDGLSYAKRIGNNTAGGFLDADGVTSRIAYPKGIVVDLYSPLKSDTIFFIDGNYAIRRADPFKAISTRQVLKTICGGGAATGSAGASGFDQSVGTKARFSTSLASIAINPVNGNIVVIDEGNNVIRSINRSGYNKVVVGINGKTDKVDGAVASATLGTTPTALFIDDNGDYYWVETGEMVVRRYDAKNKKVETVLDYSSATNFLPAFQNNNLVSLIKLGGSANTKTQLIVSMQCKVIYFEKSGSTVTEKVMVGQKGDLTNYTEDCGDKDGSGASSKVDLVTGMVMKGTDSLLISDKNNHKIKGVSIKGYITGTPDMVSYQNESFSLYPNPANSVININRLQGAEAIKVSIIDIQGRSIYQNIVNGDKNQINISDLPNGIYQVMLQSDKSVMSQKLIIAH